MRALVFPIGAELYALPLHQVREVVAAPPLTALPTAPPTVMGLVNLRGDVLPVFDTSRLVGSRLAVEPAFVMVLTTADGLAGLPAGGLPRIVELGPAVGGGQATWPGSVHTLDGSPVVMLDAPSLIAGTERHA